MTYEVLRGIAWMPSKHARRERTAAPGDRVTKTDLRGADIPWLLRRDAIRKVTDDA